MRIYFLKLWIVVLCTVCLVLQPSDSEAAGTNIACSLIHATLTLGIMEPLRSVHQDNVGEIHLVCRNFSNDILSTKIVVEFGETQSGFFILDNDLGEDGIRIRLFSDPARTGELALGGGSNSTIQASLSINPKNSSELVIPIYSRADINRKTPAGNYRKSIPVIVTYE